MGSVTRPSGSRCPPPVTPPLLSPPQPCGLLSRHVPAEWSGALSHRLAASPEPGAHGQQGAAGPGLPAGLDVPVPWQGNWSSYRAPGRPRRRGCGSRWRSGSGTRSWPWRAGRWPTARTSRGSRGRRSAFPGPPPPAARSPPRDVSLLCPRRQQAQETSGWQAGQDTLGLGGRTAHGPHRGGAPGCRLTCRGPRPIFAGSSVPSEPSTGPRPAGPE